MSATPDQSTLDLLRDYLDNWNDVFTVGSPLTTAAADVSSVIMAGADMGAALTTVDVNISTLAPGKPNVSLAFTAPTETHVGVITVSESDDGVAFFPIPLENGYTGIVTNGTIAVTAGAWPGELVRLVGFASKHLRVSYAKTSGSGVLTAVLQAR
jgi:hypothetical protein